MCEKLRFQPSQPVSNIVASRTCVPCVPVSAMPMRDGEWVWGAWGRVGGQTVRQGTVRGRTWRDRAAGGRPRAPARAVLALVMLICVMNRCLAVAKWDLRAAIYVKYTLPNDWARPRPTQSGARISL